MLNTNESIIICLMIVASTIITRFLPFILFSKKKDSPYMNYLGSVLPYASMGLLVVYCLKSIDFTSTPYALPEVIAVISIIALHYWKENILRSRYSYLYVFHTVRYCIIQRKNKLERNNMIASIIIHQPPEYTIQRLKECVELTTFLSLNEVVTLLKSRKNLPANGLLVTFDHAYKKLYGDFSHKILDLGIKPTLFFHTLPLQQNDKESLNWDQVARMAEEGWELQAHTHSHTPLSQTYNHDDYVYNELQRNDMLIKQHTGIEPAHFAYPGGILADEYEKLIKERYDSACLWTASKELSYNYNLTNWQKFFNLPTGNYYPLETLYITEQTDPYRIPRVEMSELLADETLFSKYIRQQHSETLLKYK